MQCLRLVKLSHASAGLHSLLQAFETLGTIGSNLLRSLRLIEVLAGAGEKMSKAEINECLATINRFGLMCLLVRNFVLRNEMVA